MARRDPPPPEAEPEEDRGPFEIALVGDLTDNAAELTDRILSIEPGGSATKDKTSAKKLNVGG
ncbi:MAG: hypothetical protein ACKOOF_10075, partial [Planctomycetaceae bacterium]